MQLPNWQYFELSMDLKIYGIFALFSSNFPNHKIIEFDDNLTKDKTNNKEQIQLPGEM